MSFLMKRLENKPTLTPFPCIRKSTEVFTLLLLCCVVAPTLSGALLPLAGHEWDPPAKYR